MATNDSKCEDGVREKGNISPHVDRGWAWIILIAGTLTNFIMIGFCLTLGPFYVVLKEEFGESSGIMSGIVSVNFASYCGASVFGALLIKKTSCEVTLLLGVAMAFVGLIGTTFAQSIYTILVLFGLVSGLGYGFVYMGITITLSKYFNRLRVIAFGISFSGTSLGRCIYPLASQLLIDAFSWRGAFLIIGGISLNGLPTVLLFWMRTKSLRKQARRRESQMERKVIPVTASETKTSMNGLCKNDLSGSMSSGIALHKLSTEVLNTKDARRQKKVSKKMRGHSEEDWGILKLFRWSQWPFLLILVNAFAFFFGFVAVLTHLVPLVREAGLDKYQAATILTLLGVGNFIGRFLTGFIAHSPKVNLYLFFGITLILSGVMTLFIAWVTDFVLLVIISFIFAMMAATFEPLSIEATFRVSSAEQFTVAWAIVNIPMTLGSFIGAPFVGWIYDVTAFYPASFYVGGSILIISGGIILPVCLRNDKKASTPAESRNEEPMFLNEEEVVSPIDEDDDVHTHSPRRSLSGSSSL